MLFRSIDEVRIYNYALSDSEIQVLYSEGGWPPPIVSTVSPSSGTTLGGTSVTISGSDFGSTQGSGTVTFGGTAAASYTSWSATQIMCVTPAHAAGAVDAVITANNGLSGTRSLGYTYITPPSVTTVSPTSGSTAGGTSVTLSGSNFGSTQGLGTVTFGGTAAASYISWSATQIMCVTPAHAAGAVDAVITANNGLSGTKSSGFTYSETYQNNITFT